MKPRIFISCVGPEFRTLRSKVAHVLQFLGYEPVFQEVGGTQSGDIQKILADKVDSCEGLVQIVGDGYGTELPEPHPEFGRISYTQFEFLYARSRGKRTWLLYAGPDAQRDTPPDALDLPVDDPGHPDPAGYQSGRRALQAGYRKARQGEGHLHHPVNTAAELENAVLKLRDDSEALRGEFQRWQAGVAEGQGRIEARQGRHFAAMVAALLLLALLGGGAFWYFSRKTDEMAGAFGGSQADPKKIRENGQVRIGADYAATVAGIDAREDLKDSWRKRQELKDEAAAERDRLLAALDRFVESMQTAYREGEVSGRYAEFARIAEAEGIAEALAYYASVREENAEEADSLLGLRDELDAELRAKLRLDLDAANAQAAEGDLPQARATYAAILKKAPPWAEARYAFVQFLLYTEGLRQESHGTVAGAEAIYVEAERHARRLTEDKPDEPKWQREYSVSLEKLGDVEVARGDLGAAAGHYGAGMEIDRKLAESDPANAGWQRDLSVSLNKLGEVAEARGDLDAAAGHYGGSMEIARKLAESAPWNAGWQRDLSVSLNNLGGVAEERGDLDAAAGHYGAGMEIREKLAESDPGNAGWQRDLSVSLDKLGDVAVSRGDLDAAAGHYGAGMEIREKLAESDPGNAAWQRDLSVGLIKMGDVAVSRGDLDAAEGHYGAGREIREKLAESEPGNAGSQRDLSVSLNKLGDVEVARGDLDGAAGHYGGSMEIFRRLAESAPGNAGWQRDLFVSYYKLGDLAGKRGRWDEALESFESALAISEKLADKDPTNATWQNDLKVIRGLVEEARGKAEGE